MPEPLSGGPPGSLRDRVFNVIFHTDTPAGRTFDVALIAAIVGSVLVVMLESVAGLRMRHGLTLRIVEWMFTILFSIEYVLRLWSVRRPGSYALSFFGIIDVLAVLPTYLSVVAPGGQVLAVVRVLRVVRVFRVFKLARYVGEARVLTSALRASRFKISVFLVAVLSIVIIVGSIMYLVEGPAAGFTSIPKGIYWAVVTLTTVGYGDIIPTTALGQALSAVVMIMGYGIIAVPTGIVTAELTVHSRAGMKSRTCGNCLSVEDDAQASFCRRCGKPLPD